MSANIRRKAYWQLTLLGFADMVRWYTVGRPNGFSRWVADRVEKKAANEDVQKLAAKIRSENTTAEPIGRISRFSPLYWFVPGFICLVVALSATQDESPADNALTYCGIVLVLLGTGRLYQVIRAVRSNKPTKP